MNKYKAAAWSSPSPRNNRLAIRRLNFINNKADVLQEPELKESVSLDKERTLEDILLENNAAAEQEWEDYVPEKPIVKEQFNHMSSGHAHNTRDYYSRRQNTYTDIYPKSFGPIEIKYFENLATQLTDFDKKVLSGITGRKPYSAYEEALVGVTVATKTDLGELTAVFTNNPYCCERSRKAIIQRRSILNQDDMLNNIIKRFQRYVASEKQSQGQSYQSQPEKPKRETQRDFDGPVAGDVNMDLYEATMEKTYSRAKSPNQHNFPKAPRPQINMDVVVPEITESAFSAESDALDKHIKGRSDMAALISVYPYSYDVMQDRKALYNLFYKKTRKIDSNEARMLYVSDIARFWGTSEESAQDLIDDMCEDGFPLVRNGQEIYMVETKQEGSNLSHLIIDDIPSYDIGGGVKCTSVGILSDTHYGAEDCSVDSIRDYYARAYHNYNVRCFLHGGDFFNGHNVFKAQEFENQYVGFDQQLEHAAEVHPYFGSEVRTYSILGNHDESYIKNAGANILNALHDKRQDIVPIGLYQGLVTINGFNINLHHAAGGCGRNNPWGKINNICGQKQAIVTKYGLDKLDLLVVGHYHRTEVMSSFKQYDVQTAIFGGSFQKSNPFSVRIGSIDTILGGYVADLYEMPDGTKRVNISMIEAKGKDGYCNQTAQTVLSSHLSSSRKRTGGKSCS